jgi:squalene-hopene/tetraprenyl-beta-curcumene cyclase
VPQLPFELAACPHSWFRFLKLPVVSYALPALIAIGQVRHVRRPTWNPLTRLIRAALSARTLNVLQQIQPKGGGFLEAAPLTSFVVMSLVGAGQSGHEVVREGVGFLRRSVRPDGSWPIDTNLSTWVTTLAVNALGEIDPQSAGRIRAWLLDQQYRCEHPYTHAPPGGWAWTDLPGGVPDADDTPGALLALHKLGAIDNDVAEAAWAGLTWLLDLQNRDGGMPTFCRGWGNLPFDRSGADLTGHVMLAWLTWKKDLPELSFRIDGAMRRSIEYLQRTQRADGAWTPLWFGNQFAPNEENPTYGTARVLIALHRTQGNPQAKRMWNKGIAWLLSAQNEDGGWGGAKGVASSIEETALAVSAIADHEESVQALRRGAKWLLDKTQGGRVFAVTPIGFYFAKLWYYEEMYPLIFTVAALGRLANRLP